MSECTAKWKIKISKWKGESTLSPKQARSRTLNITHILRAYFATFIILSKSISPVPSSSLVPPAVLKHHFRHTRVQLRPIHAARGKIHE